MGLSSNNLGELLLPVGSMEMCLAAIHNGADAIYIGMPEFNARGRTKDHSLTELEEIINLCHLYGVKVHLAFNILIFEDELNKAIELLYKVLPLGPDAIIVQDLGLARVIRRMSANQVIHASTQMTITCDLAIACLEELNIQRFVLARECSLTDIQKIKQQTSKELEVFVHGALCVAYSGQCYTSESIGGRSANRGQCAQSCRLDYDLIVDGKKHSTFDRRYLVSPLDLMGLAEIPKLQDLGVTSFKVEGRLKGPDYVAATARHYKAVMRDGIGNDFKNKTTELERTYSRGFFTGWLHGVDHQKLVEGTYSNHRGEFLATVQSVGPTSFSIKTSRPISPGDGLVLSGKNSKEFGAFVYHINSRGDEREISFEKNFDYRKILSGMRVFLNKDPKLEKELAKSWGAREQQKKIPLNLHISGQTGKFLEIQARDDQANLVTTVSEHILQKAKDYSASHDEILQTIGALGAVAFSLGQIVWDLQDGLFIPNKILKDMRKDMVKKMEQMRTQVAPVSLNFVELAQIKSDLALTTGLARLTLMLRSQKQLEEFLSESKLAQENWKNKISRVILDYEFGKNYADSVQMLKDFGLPVYIATTRILRPGELNNLKSILRAGPDGILVRNLGALHFFNLHAPDLPVVADYSFNVTNSKTAEFLIQKGAKEICLGLDLNQWQVDDILNMAPAAWFEIIVHHYMPEFHMEHCVFAAFLSQGSSFRDCNKPCEKHVVSMKDPYGNFHHLAADQECRNTMFATTPTSATGLIQNWYDKGVRSFRIEGLSESGSDLFKKVVTYDQLLQKNIDKNEARESIGGVESFGVSSGQMQKKDSYQDRKK